MSVYKIEVYHVVWVLRLQIRGVSGAHYQTSPLLLYDSGRHKLFPIWSLSTSTRYSCQFIFPAPPKQFELAFKMFDDNGDGNLDPEEYEKVGVVIVLDNSAYA